MKRSTRLATTAAVAVLFVTVGISSAVATAVARRGPAAPEPRATLAATAATTPQKTPELLFVAIPPCRAVDTRSGGGTLASGAVRTFTLAGTSNFTAQGGKSGGCGIPLSATTVATTITAVSPSARGYLRVWSATGTEPTSAYMNYGTEFNASSSGQAPISTAGQVKIRNENSTTQLLVDVTGYYVPQIQALINGDGTISSGTARVVSVQHSSLGFYYVTLDRAARECSPSALTYNFGHYASVGLSSTTTPNVISVSTWNSNSAGGAVLADLPFFLTVTC